MATFININEKRPQYDFLDAKCIGRRCFHALNYGGLACCMNRRLNGCPDPLPEFSQTIAERNLGKGYRLSK